MPAMQCTAFILTVNGVTSDVAHALPQHPDERYAAWQLEKGVNGGNIHVQAYLELRVKKTFANVIKVFTDAGWPHPHVEKRRGSPEQARDYCTKEDTREDGPWFRGDFGHGGQGKRNDIGDAVKFLREGGSKRDLIDEHPMVLARYPRFVEQVIADTREQKRVKLTDIVPRDWQQPILDMVNEPPSSRQILWVYDETGGAGKTYLARHLIDKYDAFYSNGGKTGDIAYSYNYEPIVIFDFTRDSENYVNYQCMEALKNGIISCNKYESTTKKFDTPHVIVFANFLPADNKLSKDRLVVLELGLNGNFHLHDDAARLAFA